MENRTSPRKPFLLIIAMVLLIVPIVIQVSWIRVFSMDHLIGWEEKQKFYLSHYPSFIHSIYVTFWIAFFFCFLSFVLSALSLSKLEHRHRWMAYITFFVSFLVGFVVLFQMM